MNVIYCFFVYNFRVMSDQLHAPAALPSRKDPSPRTHWVGGLVGPRSGLDGVEKRKCLTLPIPKLLPYPLGRRAGSQSSQKTLLSRKVPYLDHAIHHCFLPCKHV
jgi:hypothetical protein